MRLLNSCCRCISLKVGTIITGSLGIIWSLFIFIIPLVSTVKFKFIVSENVSPLATKIIFIINAIFVMLISILLIVGAVQRKIWYMLPWIILSIIIFLGTLVSVIYTAAEDFANKESLRGSLQLLFGLLFVAFEIYLWLVVLSYFEQVREKRDINNT